MRWGAGFCAFAGVVLAGCMVGPDFVHPELPEGAGYLPDSIAQTASAPVQAGTPQKLANGQPVLPDWWTLFKSPALNALVAQALANNPNIEAAEATLKSAIANARAQEGSLFPSIASGFNASRNKTPGDISPTPASNATLYNLYTAQVSVAYTLDVFGGVRRSIEAQEALADFQLFQMRAAHLTLAANVAGAAVNEAALREQIQATVEIIHVQKEILQTLKLQSDKGQIAGIDVVAQETALAQSELSLQPLRKQLAQNQNLLAALLGNFPNNASPQRFRLGNLHLPRRLPLSLPSTLIRQRPDIMAAEATLHNASANVGVATANRLPSITLAANYGASSVVFDALTAGSNRLWSVAGNAAQVVFDGDALRQKQKAAEAALEAADASYRGTVLTAFQNVADALRAIQYDAVALAAAAKAENSARDYLEISRQKLQLGAANSLVLLSAQQAYQQARIALIQAQAARLSDTIALCAALGGGWWSNTEAAIGVPAPPKAG